VGVRPPTLDPAGHPAFGVGVHRTWTRPCATPDVVMLLRIQLERMEGAYFPSLREYFQVFGMTEARLRCASRT
jgi:aspartate carbamoyltransferase catalytic subunit